eukprot:scaffold56382_cov64-Attheya_sp.AAC.1
MHGRCQASLRECPVTVVIMIAISGSSYPNGQKEKPGLPSHIWLDEKCTKIGLGVSRGIGDFTLKHSGVMIPDPGITNRALSPNDKFMIVASDGVWGFIESEEAVQIVQDGFNEGNNATEACIRLIKAAMWNIGRNMTVKPTGMTLRQLWFDGWNCGLTNKQTITESNQMDLHRIA